MDPMSAVAHLGAAQRRDPGTTTEPGSHSTPTTAPRRGSWQGLCAPFDGLRACVRFGRSSTSSMILSGLPFPYRAWIQIRFGVGWG